MLAWQNEDWQEVLTVTMQMPHNIMMMGKKMDGRSFLSRMFVNGSRSA
jgi:hypothetical protein